MQTKLIQERLDITKIKTVDDLNSVNFSKYADKQYESWVRHIVLPVTTKALNEICDLSTKEGSMVNLGWSMGEIFYSNKVLL